MNMLIGFKQLLSIPHWVRSTDSNQQIADYEKLVFPKSNPKATNNNYFSDAVDEVCIMYIGKLGSRQTEYSIEQRSVCQYLLSAQMLLVFRINFRKFDFENTKANSLEKALD